MLRTVAEARDRREEPQVARPEFRGFLHERIFGILVFDLLDDPVLPFKDGLDRKVLQSRPHGFLHPRRSTWKTQATAVHGRPMSDVGQPILNQIILYHLTDTNVPANTRRNAASARRRRAARARSAGARSRSTPPGARAASGRARSSPEFSP